jgi:hypothetical protein
MTIINHFNSLQTESKIAVRFRKYPTEIFCGTKRFEYGVKISLFSGRILNKDYEKFSLITKQHSKTIDVIIRSNCVSEDELEVFAYLVEYVLFELGKKSNATPADIKRFIDDWLKFSRGKAPEISIEKQIGIIGELLILKELILRFPAANQLNNWHGPEGAKIDFIFSDRFGLEVKSRIQPFKDWVSISSVEQLDNDLEYQHIAICDFLPSDTGKTLKEFTDEVIILLDDRDKANVLIEKMKKVNFDYFIPYSNLIKVNLFRQSIYDTKNEAFPILRKPIDSRIDKIKYDINISGLSIINFTETIAKIRNQLEQS